MLMPASAATSLAAAPGSVAPRRRGSARPPPARDGRDASGEHPSSVLGLTAALMPPSSPGAAVRGRQWHCLEQRALPLRRAAPTVGTGPLRRASAPASAPGRRDPRQEADRHEHDRRRHRCREHRRRHRPPPPSAARSSSPTATGRRWRRRGPAAPEGYEVATAPSTSRTPPPCRPRGGGRCSRGHHTGGHRRRGLARAGEHAGPRRRPGRHRPPARGSGGSSPRAARAW